MNEVPSNRLSAADLPDRNGSTQVAEFAHTFDGYRHFGESFEERMDEVRKRWESNGTLPDKLDDLRACLFLEHRRERFVELDDVFSVWDADGRLIHEADPERITPERREQERYKGALVTRIAALLSERG
jgi:hypothetical protein